MKHQIAIIGAGTAGITVAAQLLRENNKLDIAIIDPADKHYYQPAWTLVGAGTYNFKDTERSMASVMPKGVKWIKDAVAEALPDQNTLVLKGGDRLEYEYLIAAPGIKMNIDAMPGMKEGMEKGIVGSVYTDPEAYWKMLRSFKGGTALFTQADTPIRCGGAPMKIMYLTEDYLRKQGTRDKAEIVFATPGSMIFGVEPFKSRLMEVVKRKDIFLNYYHAPIRIDADKQIAYFKLKETQPEKLFYNPKELGKIQVSETEVGIPFAMMHLAPPQSAPDFVRQSPLANADGWLDVNINSLQHNRYPNVFGLGDSAALPTAKTGAAIRKQAPVVVENVLRSIAGESEMSDGYKGYSSCPIVTDYGKMLLAEFKYENVRDSDPIISAVIDTGKENWPMWILKKFGLPFMYWNLMLKGRV
jgi:sulfide:quinone oxidoreductase